MESRRNIYGNFFSFFFSLPFFFFFLSFFSLKLQPVTKKLESLQLFYAKMVFLEQDSYPSSLNVGAPEARKLTVNLFATGCSLVLSL